VHKKVVSPADSPFLLHPRPSPSPSNGGIAAGNRIYFISLELVSPVYGNFQFFCIHSHVHTP
jgi:hypothetical protein